MLKQYFVLYSIVLYQYVSCCTILMSILGHRLCLVPIACILTRHFPGIIYIFSVRHHKATPVLIGFHMFHLWGVDIPLLAGCKRGGITRASITTSNFTQMNVISPRYKVHAQELMTLCQIPCNLSRCELIAQ